MELYAVKVAHKSVLKNKNYVDFLGFAIISPIK